MFAIIIGLIVIALVVTLLLKYYPQAILFMGGVVLLTCTAIFGWGELRAVRRRWSGFRQCDSGRSNRRR